MAEGNDNSWYTNESSDKKEVFRPGDLVDNRYRIEGRLGAGGMGTVYRVTHLQTNCMAALKVLHPDRAQDPVSQRLFEQELRMSSIIGPNPHLVYVYDAGFDAQRNVRYLVMNFIDGVTFKEYLEQWGPFPPELVVILGLQCARAMKQVHLAGVVHRDLKPGNIFLTFTDEGRPHAIISDFGIAKVIHGSTHAILTPVCTRDYAPPELLLANVPSTQGSPHQTTPLSVSAATDIYSFGLILYEMLTGCAPRALALPAHEVVDANSTTQQTSETVTCTISQACTRAPQLPEGSANWWKKCLQFNPAERWPSIDDAMAELVKLFEADKRFSEMDLQVNYGTFVKTFMPHGLKRNARSRLLPNSQETTTIPRSAQAPDEGLQTNIRHNNRSHKKTG